MPLLLASPMFHSSSSSKSPNCAFEATSLACPSFCRMPSLISQQSFAPGVSHIFGARSVLKMRHASMLLPSKRDFHGPACGVGACRTNADTISTMIWVMPGRYIMTTLSEGGVMDDKSKGVSRRQFIETAALTGASIAIVPRHVLGRGYTPPSDLLNIASVGIGGMGHTNLANVATQNIVAICDVDWDYAGKSLERYPRELESRKNPAPPRPGQTPNTDPARAGQTVEGYQHLVDQIPRIKRYTDFREMLAQQRDIDAVIVATPDHMHAPIASAAMDLGKHVYVQKPLCWSVEEARHLAAKAKANPKLATQMGNQGHSHSEGRTTVEYIQQGAIGDVREVHVWTNRPLGYWPQGLPRPNASAAQSKDGQPLAWNGPGVEKRLAAAMAGNY